MVILSNNPLLFPFFWLVNRGSTMWRFSSEALVPSKPQENLIVSTVLSLCGSTPFMIKENNTGRPIANITDRPLK